MRVNFIVEDMMFFKYIGCATAAKMLFKGIQKIPGVEAEWNSNEKDFDVVHFHTFGPGALLYRNFSNGVRIITAHSTPRLNKGNLAFSSVFNLLYPWMYSGFDHIITISERCAKEINCMAPGVPTTLIPNGIDTKRFRRYPKRRNILRKMYGIRDDEKIILTVAQQTPRKGIFDFLRLSKKCPESRFVWVGGFPYGIFSNQYFRIQDAKTSAGKNTVFTGFIPDILDAYSAADVFFMPSYAEGMSIVLLEAMACGVPCVVRDIPEFREVFGKDGLYFRNLSEAANILKSKKMLSKASLKSGKISSRYEIKKIAKMHTDLYRMLHDQKKNQKCF